MVEIILGFTLLITSTLLFLYLVDKVTHTSQNSDQKPDIDNHRDKKFKIHSISKKLDLVKKAKVFYLNSKALVTSLLTHPITAKVKGSVLQTSSYVVQKLPVLGDKILESLRPIKEEQEIKDKLNSLSHQSSPVHRQDIQRDNQSNVSPVTSTTTPQSEPIINTTTSDLPGFIAREEDQKTNLPQPSIDQSKKSRPRSSMGVKRVNHAISIPDDHQDEESAVLSAIKKIKTDSQTASQNTKNHNLSEEAEAPLIAAFEKSKGGKKLEQAVMLGDLYGQLGREEEQREMYLWVIKKSAPQHESIKQVAAQKLIAMR